MKTKILTLFIMMIYVSSHGQEVTPEEKGKKIGTIITSAINQALPGVQSILNLIFPDGKKKVKKDEMEERIEEVRKKIKKDMIANFQTKLSPINSNFKEIALINKFMTPSSLSEVGLMEIRTNLKEETLNWIKIKEDWSVVKKKLNSITSIERVKLQVISEAWVRKVFEKIISADDDVVVRISTRINGSNSEGVISLIDELLEFLEPIDGISSYYLENLEVDLKNLSEWSNAGMGNESSNDISKNMKLLKNTFKIQD